MPKRKLTPGEIRTILAMETKGGFTNRTGRTTIANFLGGLLGTLLVEGEGFSGKRPFGNSDWDWHLYEPLVAAGYITGSYDQETKEIEDMDWQAGAAILSQCVTYVFKQAIA